MDLQYNPNSWVDYILCLYDIKYKLENDVKASLDTVNDNIDGAARNYKDRMAAGNYNVYWQDYTNGIINTSITNCITLIENFIDNAKNDQSVLEAFSNESYKVTNTSFINEYGEDFGLNSTSDVGTNYLTNEGTGIVSSAIGGVSGAAVGSSYIQNVGYNYVSNYVSNEEVASSTENLDEETQAYTTTALKALKDAIDEIIGSDKGLTEVIVQTESESGEVLYATWADLNDEEQINDIYSKISTEGIAWGSVISLIAISDQADADIYMGQITSITGEDGAHVTDKVKYSSNWLSGTSTEEDKDKKKQDTEYNDYTEKDADGEEESDNKDDLQVVTDDELEQPETGINFANSGPESLEITPISPAISAPSTVNESSDVAATPEYSEVVVKPEYSEVGTINVKYNDNDTFDDSIYTFESREPIVENPFINNVELTSNKNTNISLENLRTGSNKSVEFTTVSNLDPNFDQNMSFAVADKVVLGDASLLGGAYEIEKNKQENEE